MRTFVVKKESGVATLLDARFRGPQGEAAMARLKAFNPGIDLDRVEPGTRLFVPDTPAFRASVTTSTAAGPVEALGKLAADALGDHAAVLGADLRTRAAERADIAAALKNPAVKRQIDADQQLAVQVEEARRLLAEEEKSDKQAEAELAALGRAAVAALAEMQKLVG